MEIRNYMARLSMKTFWIMYLTAGFAKSDAALSDEPYCWESFNAADVFVTCESNTNHRIAECKWKLNGNVLNWDPPELSQTFQGGYFLSTCRQSWARNRKGSYTVSIRMVRGGTHNNGDHGETDDPVTEIEVEIETPDQPTLSAWKGSITNSVLTVTEEDDVILTCSSNGGKPKNTYMNLECKPYPPYTRKVYNMDTVSLYFTIKEDMNGEKCICSAKHITTQIITTELTMYVLVPPRLSMYNAGTGVQITSEIIVKEKQTITLECKSIGGMPATSKMILSCPRDRTTSNHIEHDETYLIRLSVGFNNGMNGRNCSCSVQHPSGPSSINLMILIVETPEHPKLNVSNGRITNGFLEITDNEYAVLTCRSDGGKPTNTYMTLECPTDPPYTETVNNIDTVSLGVTIQKDMNGRKCSCSAKHITTPILTTDVTIDVLEIPDQPKLSVSNGRITNGFLRITDKEDVVLTCRSDGGKPTNTYMTLECSTDPPYRKTVNNIDTVSLDVTIQKKMDLKKCICSAKHITTAILTTNVTIDVLVPPTLSMHNADTGVEMTSTIHVKDNQTITLKCQSNGGRPATSKMILTCPSDGTTRNHTENNDTDIIRLSVHFNKDMDRRHCSCSVQHPSGYASIKLMILIVVTPSNLVIYADKGLVIDSKLIVKENENVYLTCKSLGGKPKQSDMTISCHYRRLSQYTDTIGTYISFTRDVNGQQCNCSAKHISSNESLTTLLTITVVVVPQTPLCHTDFDNNSAIITCTTSKVFPGANCQFNSFDGFETLMLPMAEASRHSIRYYPVRDTVGYYNTTCRTSLAITRRSNFTISSSMFPELQLRNELEKYYNFVKVHKTFKFEVDSAKIQTFTINKRNPNYVKHVNAKSETTLTCTAFGNPLLTIVISYIDSTRERTTISRGNAYELSHKFNPTCSDTGLYRCNVSNMLNAQEETYAFNLKVPCPAEYYQTTYNLPRFGVPVNEDFNITLPVRVYPEPKNFSLFQGSSPIRQPKKILFTYTNENFSLGEISIVAMRLQNETGLGVYSLRVWNPQESTLNFNLTVEGHPLCPTDFIIETISTNAMTISWRPGFNGGSAHIFSVFSHDPANNLTDSFQVEQTSNDVMVYNLTGLSEGTLYLLSVETENSKGKTQCPHMNINGTTSAGSKQSPSEMYSLIIFIGLTAAMIIISGVACGLLCNKRVALKRCCTFQSSHTDLYDTPETRETHLEDYYLQPVHSVEQVQDISPNEYDMVNDNYEDALSEINQVFKRI